jgi:hypothetical protein
MEFLPPAVTEVTAPPLIRPSYVAALGQNLRGSLMPKLIIWRLRSRRNLEVILLGGVLTVLAIAGATTAFKLTHRPALAAQPLDPALLHGFLQRGRDEMALP